MLRIIGGEFRGRKINQPEFDTVRPTKDRIRESVFNVIAASIPGTSVLDAFAGSGAYGLEALSRGAVKAAFLEKDPRCCKVIRENIGSLGIAEKAQIVTADAFEWIELSPKGQNRFDIAFADPPYAKGMAKKFLIKINHYDILNHFGLLIIEHNCEESLPDAEGAFILLKRKTYADVSVSFYQKNG